MLSIAGCDGNVSNRRVKPHVENFVFIFLQGNLRAPFQVTGDASAYKTTFKHGVSKTDRVLRPVSFNRSLSYPLFKFWLNLRQVDKDVL